MRLATRTRPAATRAPGPLQDPLRDSLVDPLVDPIAGHGTAGFSPPIQCANKKAKTKKGPAPGGIVKAPTRVEKIRALTWNMRKRSGGRYPLRATPARLKSKAEMVYEMLENGKIDLAHLQELEVGKLQEVEWGKSKKKKMKHPFEIALRDLDKARKYKIKVLESKVKPKTMTFGDGREQSTVPQSSNDRYAVVYNRNTVEVENPRLVDYTQDKTFVDRAKTTTGLMPIGDFRNDMGHRPPMIYDGKVLHSGGDNTPFTGFNWHAPEGGGGGKDGVYSGKDALPSMTRFGESSTLEGLQSKGPVLGMGDFNVRPERVSKMLFGDGNGHHHQHGSGSPWDGMVSDKFRFSDNPNDLGIDIAKDFLPVGKGKDNGKQVSDHLPLTGEIEMDVT